MKEMRPKEIAAAIEADPRLIVPIGTCEQHGPHLPLGCDTIIVERLADTLCAEFQVLRAPTLEYGVNVETEKRFVGNAPEHSNAQETETTTSKKGSINSSHEQEEECEGPPGQCN